MLARNAIGSIGGVVALAAVLGACGDYGVGPEAITREDITRSFSAVTLTTTTDGTTTDQLAAGATLSITLHEDGTTAGQLFVPGGAEDGGDFDADLAGTFSFDDSTDRVTFDHDADTFMRDMTFAAARSGDGVRLEAQQAFGAATVRVVLR